MDCLRSFSFSTNLISTLTTGGADLKQWTTSAGNHYWQAYAGTSSTYNIQGFTNIDVYGIDVIGNIQTQSNIGTNGVIVNDWSIDVSIDGQAPLVGGNVVGGYYGLDLTIPDNNIFALGKYTNSVKFESPYISAKSIVLGKTRAQGIAFQTTGSINLFYKVNFVVYYKFQGE